MIFVFFPHPKANSSLKPSLVYIEGMTNLNLPVNLHKNLSNFTKKKINPTLLYQLDIFTLEYIFLFSIPYSIILTMNIRTFPK